MYFLPEARGHGMGKELLLRCLWAARAFGYRRCYLESLGAMTQAIGLYESFGFERLSAALGNTTHHGCNRYYAKSLDDLSTLPDPTAKSAEVTLADIEAAAVRIAGAVRRTPTLELVGMKEPIAGLRSLWLKLELLQVTGSFKARGLVMAVSMGKSGNTNRRLRNPVCLKVSVAVTSTVTMVDV